MAPKDDCDMTRRLVLSLLSDLSQQFAVSYSVRHPLLLLLLQCPACCAALYWRQLCFCTAWSRIEAIGPRLTVAISSCSILSQWLPCPTNHTPVRLYPREAWLFPPDYARVACSRFVNSAASFTALLQHIVPVPLYSGPLCTLHRYLRTIYRRFVASPNSITSRYCCMVTRTLFSSTKASNPDCDWCKTSLGRGPDNRPTCCIFNGSDVRWFCESGSRLWCYLSIALLPVLVVLIYYNTFRTLWTLCCVYSCMF